MFWKTISIAIILFICTINVEAWVMRAVYHNDNHPGKCYVNEHLILSPGQIAKSPEGCSEIRCNSEEGEVQIVGCGKVADPENCTWVGLLDVNAPFPLCCIQNFECDSPADEENARKLQQHLREMFTHRVEEKKNRNGYEAIRKQ